MVILSDTNIFIDLNHTGLLGEFFQKFDDVYAENSIFESEILRPETMKNELLSLGLKLTSITAEEVPLAGTAQASVPQLSQQDCIAFAVCKSRSWTLVTGDRRLRNHAQDNGVDVHGFVWILQECLARGTDEKLINAAVQIAMTHGKMMMKKQLFLDALPSLFDENGELKSQS